jgi:hypothetical protein
MMKWKERFRAGLVALAATGILAPQPSVASGPMASASVAGPVAPAHSVRDFALQHDGTLRGQVVDAAGHGASETEIAVLQQGRVVVSGRTDAQGHYALHGLQAGVSQVVTEQGVTVCRVWTARTAPPSAQANALLVHDDQVIRGHLGNGGLVRFLSNPWVLGGIVAAAIVIPLALDRDDAS